MNVTVLPQEKTDEASPLVCEVEHDHSICTGPVVGYTFGLCQDAQPLLSCIGAVHWVLTAIEAGDFYCDECGLDYEDCWSVVMLP